jgi:hypothetical protein
VFALLFDSPVIANVGDWCDATYSCAGTLVLGSGLWGKSHAETETAVTSTGAPGVELTFPISVGMDLGARISERERMGYVLPKDPSICGMFIAPFSRCLSSMVALGVSSPRSEFETRVGDPRFLGEGTFTGITSSSASKRNNERTRLKSDWLTVSLARGHFRRRCLQLS